MQKHSGMCDKPSGYALGFIKHSLVYFAQIPGRHGITYTYVAIEIHYRDHDIIDQRSR